MKEHKLELQIRKAVEHTAPDQLESILSSCDEQQIAAHAPSECRTGQKKGAIIPMPENKNVKTKRRKASLAAIAAVAAVFVLCFGGYGLFMQGATTRADAVITLDVNPSLSLYVDANEKVLSAETLNQDAQDILGTMDLKNTSLEVAVNAIIGSMLQKGYLGDLQNSILVSVEDSDAARGERLQQKVSQTIASAMQVDSVAPAILTQSVSGDDAALAELAQQYGISLGKAALIQEVIGQMPELTFGTLASKTINEIALLATSSHLTGEGVTQSGVASDKAYIGQQEALERACAHAGASPEDVLKSEAEFDLEDGQMVYDVKFETGAVKCEYTIDARTGTVLEAEVKAKGAASEADGKDKTGTSEPTPTADNYIGETAAKNAALTHAGIRESDTYYVKCYLEYESGKPICYCVEFEAGDAEYEYEIDLYSGAVLESDVERHSEVPGSGTDSAGYIGENAAKTAALTHAGVQESDTYYIGSAD